MLTRRAGAWAVTGAGGKEIVGGLRKWVQTQGTPSVLCSDVCKATQSKELQQWCTQMGVTQEYSPPYHHASIGFVERFNQTLLNRLRCMWAENPRYFAKVVENAVEIYNDTPLSSPKERRRPPNPLCLGHLTSCGRVHGWFGLGYVSIHGDNEQGQTIEPEGGVFSGHSRQGTECGCGTQKLRR